MAARELLAAAMAEAAELWYSVGKKETALEA
jgi:hypothetical protein